MLETIDIFQKSVVRKAESKFVPTTFLNLFRWQGLEQSLNVYDDPAKVKKGLYPLNLGSIYRLSDKMAALRGSGGSVAVYQGLDRTVWKKIEENDGLILLDMTVECFFVRPQTVEGLYEGLQHYDIDPRRVGILNSNLASREAFDGLRASLGFEPGPQMLGFNGCYWLLNGFNRVRPETADSLAARLNRTKSNLNIRRSKKFVSFNGRLRPHRFFVVLWLLRTGHLQEGYVSFLGYGQGEEPNSEALAAMISRFPDSAEATQWIRRLLDLMPLSLDINRESSGNFQAFKSTLPWTSPAPEPYDDAYFSIVVDTLFTDPDVLFLTPIAFKSFMNLSPFVYFGNPGALAEMRRMGFQTFSPLIEEGYDQIPDHNHRMAATLRETDRLLRLSPARLHEMYRELWPRLEHNFRRVHEHVPDAFLVDFDARALGHLRRRT